MPGWMHTVKLTPCTQLNAQALSSSSGTLNSSLVLNLQVDTPVQLNDCTAITVS